MLGQGRSCVAPQTVFRLTCSFRKSFLLTQKFGTACAIEMTAQREEWSELLLGATTATRTRSGTSVTRKSSIGQPTDRWTDSINQLVEPGGRADIQLISTRHSSEVKGCDTTTIRCRRTQPLLMMAIQITNKQERGTHILSACTAGVGVSKQ